MKETILYDNTNLYDMREEIRLELFDEWAADQDWITETDVPDSMIDDEIRFRDEREWEDMKWRLEGLLSGGHFLLTGTFGSWMGPEECGKFINSYSDLIGCLQHLDSITFYDRDGHLIIEGYHHDGHDHYELKKLTNKGYEYADKNYFAHSKQLHQTIFNNNFFSSLPRLASI